MEKFIKINSKEELNRFNELSKFTIEDIKRMVSKGEKLETLDEYAYLLNCVILEGTDQMLEEIQNLIPKDYYSDDACSVCGHNTLGNSYDEPHARTLCPVCGQTEDMYLHWEEHRELQDGSILWFNYFGDTWDLKEGAQRLYSDLQDENRKVFNVVPFKRRNSSEYKLPFFKDFIKPDMNEYFKLYVSVSKLGEDDKSEDTQTIVKNVIEILNSRSDYTKDGLPYRVKRVLIDSSNLHNK